jgi:hypothetical protein
VTRGLSWKSVIARRLARHRLDAAAPRAKLVDVVSDVCGIHAQVMPSAEISLGLRIRDFTRAHLHDALWVKRELVKTYGIRGTVHLLPAREYGWWLAALRAGWRRDHDVARLAYLGMTKKQMDATIDAIADAVSATPITREDLGEEVARRVGRWAVERTVNAFGGQSRVWQAAIGGAAMRGDLIFGPPVGARVTFVRPSDWLGKTKPPREPDAQVELMRRFLFAYGPATAAEFAQWAFLDTRRANEIAKALGDAIEPVGIEGHRAWQIAGDRAPRASESTLLLPRFDCYAVGFHPRDVIASPAVVARASATGLLPARLGSGRAYLVGPMPVLLLDGVVGGIWESTRGARRIAIRVQPLLALDRKRRRAIDDAAARIGEIVGLEPTVTIGKVSTRPHL